MKKLRLFYLLICAVGVVMAATACGDDIPGETIIEPQPSDEAYVKITHTGSVGAEVVTVAFVPSDNSSKFEYMIGSEEDREAFEQGATTTTTVESPETLEHSFTGLTPNDVYVVYARAYNKNGEVGPVSTSKVITNGQFSVSQQFVSHISAGWTVKTYFTYNAIHCAVSKTVDIAAFERGALPGQKVFEHPYATVYPTFFDLEPGTEYFLHVRAKDRFMEDNPVDEDGSYVWTGLDQDKQYWGETLTFPVTTAASVDENSGVKIEFTHNDFFTTFINMVPQGEATAYGFAWTEPGGYEYIDNPATGAGNYLGQFYNFMAYQQMSVWQQEGEFYFPNLNFIDGYEHELFLLTLDPNLDPLHIVKYNWTNPLPDNSVTDVARVDVQIEPLRHGANYTFTPNRYTVGYFYETFTAEYVDGDDASDPGVKDDDWMYEYFTANASNFRATGKYQYYYLEAAGLWTGTWTDQSGKWEDWQGEHELPSGTELEIVVMPMNINGLHGKGTLTRERYNIL